MITSKLALRQLLKNKKRTIITLFGIILSVSMITAIAGFAESGRDILRRSYIADSGDWHVAFTNVTAEDAEKLKNEPRVENVYTEYEDEQITVKFRLKKPDKNYAQVMVAIYDDNEISYHDYMRINTQLLMAEGVMDDTTMTTIYSFCGILIFIVVIGSVLVIANSFSISTNERIRQFGLLKSAGATKEQICRIVIIEALVLAVIAIPVGIAVGFLIEKIALDIANSLLREALNMTPGGLDGKFHVIFSLPVVLIATAVSFLTITVSAWLPARKASRISAIDSIRLTKEIKIKPKKVKTPKLITTLFGFEGTLADKSLKRNSGKYRATVISLVTSMVLFIGGFSFSENLMKATDMVYTDYGINACVTIIDQKTVSFEAKANKLYNIDGAETWLSYAVTYPADNLARLLTDKTQNTTGIMMQIHSMTDERFSQLCKELSINSKNMDGGILINVTNTRVDGKRAELKPVNFTKNMSVAFGTNNEYSVTLLAETSAIPKDIIAVYGNHAINVVVSEDTFSQYYKEGETVMATVSAFAADSEDFCEKADEIITGQIGEEEKNAAYSISDIERETRLNRNLNLLVTVFIMGFVGLLSLIAVTSVIGTISTNMSLRRQEFAMLQSVGMTQRDLHRMLNFESLLYGLKALIFGIPLGIITSWLFHLALSNSLIYGYILPLNSIIICVIAVLLLTFSTMRYSASKMDKGNISEILRMEII